MPTDSSVVVLIVTDLGGYFSAFLPTFDPPDAAARFAGVIEGKVVEKRQGRVMNTMKPRME